MNEDFVHRAVDQADLNALRIALLQATGLPELEAMKLEPVSLRAGHHRQLVVSAQDTARIKELAVAFLLNDAESFKQTVPGPDEVDRLVARAHGEPVRPENRKMRRDMLAWGDFPQGATWTADRPSLPEGFRVAIIGAGFCGIGMAIQLQQLGVPYVVLERKDEIGGVWSANTYPDARVDTLSSTYQYSFEKNFPWTEYFARQPEVRGYLEHVAVKFGVMENVRFGQDVAQARFDDEQSRWVLQVRTSQGEEHELIADVVISAAGLFAVPKRFEAPGLEQFAGEVVHTTEWMQDTHSVDGKRVAVVGNGSTGVQLLGGVAKTADQVYVFQRTAQWISPREKYGEVVSPESQWLLAAMPYYWNWSRYMALMPGFDSHDLVVPDSEWITAGGLVNERNDGVRTGLVRYIKYQLGERQDLADDLIPSYAPFARRPVVDNGWYRALTRPNVELVTEQIDRFVEKGILTRDGQERPVDLVIAAVGFRTSMYLHPASYHGVGNRSLADAWSKDGPRAYLGMTVPDFPNFFMLYGPNSQPLSGGGSLPAWFELWTHYVAQCLVSMLEAGHTRIEVREDIYADYNIRLDEAASGLIHLQDEGSRQVNYYLNEFGRMQVNAPWNGEDYYRWSGTPDMSDFSTR